MKICSTCGKDQPADDAHFYRTCKGGPFRSQCKACKQGKERAKYDALDLAGKAAHYQAKQGRRSAESLPKIAAVRRDPAPVFHDDRDDGRSFDQLFGFASVLDLRIAGEVLA